MIEWLGSSLSAVALGGAAYAWSRRARARQAYYRELAKCRALMIHGREPVVAAPAPSFALRQSFARESVVRVADFLTPESFKRLRDEALAVLPHRKRSYIPTHKKGAAVSYESLHRYCPACLAFYHTAPVRDWASHLVGLKLGPAGNHDQSASSLLIYDEPGDHIHWHFDHNFYKGRQFTALINLVNQNRNGGVSASQFVYKSAAGIEVKVDTSPNSFLLFEGAKVLHRATPTEHGDLRLMLSMTYNTDARIGVLGEGLRRVKDTAFFGLRVLWA